MNFFTKYKRLNTLIFCIISGLLLGFSYPPFKTWFFIYPGLMLLLYLVLNAVRLRQAFGRAYLTMFIFNEVSLYWISGWHSDDTFLKIGGVATVFVHSLFMLIPLLIIYGVAKYKKSLAIALFPLIWVGYEYFDNVWQFSFPWLELGNTETYNLTRIQTAELFGVHGLSFLICVITAILYFTYSNIYHRSWKTRSLKSIISLVIIFGLILFPNFYGNYRLNSVDNTKYFDVSSRSKTVNTAIIQSNTDPFKKWKGDHDKLLDTYIDGLHDGLKFNPDMLVLHETSTPYYFLDDVNLLKSKRFFDLADSSDKYIMMGIPYRYYYNDTDKIPSDHRTSEPSKRKFDVFNAAILIEPHKHYKEFKIHKKVKLVPFSERIPYQEKVPFLKKWFTWGVGISGWQMGNDKTIFTLKDSVKGIDTKFAGLICFESVFSEFVSEFAKNGAEYFIIVTNDGWWGNTSGPEQHNQYAVLRAIENRKWIVRCAQTGVSCFIDPIGNIHDRIEYWQQGVADRNITANTEITIYTEYGDLTGKLGMITIILSFLGAVTFYFYKKSAIHKERKQ
ncbi:MAG: apolipoprotein N-acyltransferase [Ignavibacteria bacterium]|nr:apolipoprotein N-acyltransferase [Ignavibacteria bacterium]